MAERHRIWPVAPLRAYLSAPVAGPLLGNDSRAALWPDFSNTRSEGILLNDRQLGWFIGTDTCIKHRLRPGSIEEGNQRIHACMIHFVNEARGRHFGFGGRDSGGDTEPRGYGPKFPSRHCVRDVVASRDQVLDQWQQATQPVRLARATFPRPPRPAGAYLYWAPNPAARYVQLGNLPAHEIHRSPCDSTGTSLCSCLCSHGSERIDQLFLTHRSSYAHKPARGHLRPCGAPIRQPEHPSRSQRRRRAHDED